MKNNQDSKQKPTASAPQQPSANSLKKPAAAPVKKPAADKPLPSPAKPAAATSTEVEKSAPTSTTVAAEIVGTSSVRARAGSFLTPPTTTASPDKPRRNTNKSDTFSALQKNLAATLQQATTPASTASAPAAIPSSSAESVKPLADTSEKPIIKEIIISSSESITAKLTQTLPQPPAQSLKKAVSKPTPQLNPLKPSAAVATTANVNVNSASSSAEPPRPPIPPKLPTSPKPSNNENRQSLKEQLEQNKLQQKFNKSDTPSGLNPAPAQQSNIHSSSTPVLVRAKLAAKSSPSIAAKQPATSAPIQTQATVPVAETAIATGNIKTAAEQASTATIPETGVMASVLSFFGIQAEEKTPQTVQEQLPFIQKNLGQTNFAQAAQQIEEKRQEKFNTQQPAAIPELQEKLARTSFKETEQQTTTRMARDENNNNQIQTQTSQSGKNTVLPNPIKSEEFKSIEPQFLNKAATPLPETERLAYLRLSKEAENNAKVYANMSAFYKEMATGRFQNCKNLFAYMLRKLLDTEVASTLAAFDQQTLKLFASAIDSNPDDNQIKNNINHLAIQLFTALKSCANNGLNFLISTLKDAAVEMKDIPMLIALSGYYANTEVELKTMLEKAKDVDQEAFEAFLCNGKKLLDDKNLLDDETRNIFKGFIPQSSYRPS